jgi:hypothetical protein
VVGSGNESESGGGNGNGNGNDKSTYNNDIEGGEQCEMMK